jgi:hypothetical protein
MHENEGMAAGRIHEEAAYDISFFLFLFLAVYNDNVNFMKFSRVKLYLQPFRYFEIFPLCGKPVIYSSLFELIDIGNYMDILYDVSNPSSYSTVAIMLGKYNFDCNLNHHDLYPYNKQITIFRTTT